MLHIQINESCLSLSLLVPHIKVQIFPLKGLFIATYGIPLLMHTSSFNQMPYEPFQLSKKNGSVLKKLSVLNTLPVLYE